MIRKHFTLAEANRTLPLVKRIVADLTTHYPVWRDLIYKYELVAAQARPEWGESNEQLALRTQIEDAAKLIAGYIQELEEIGCLFKRFPPRLAHFCCTPDGRDVFSCWKAGDETIEYCPEIVAGFSGRQGVPSLLGC